MTSRKATTRFTNLSDRFRSIWTFYQFLGGVFKHQGKGGLPLTYDFQGLYKRIQALLPMIGDGSSIDLETLGKVEKIEKELAGIHKEVSGLEQEFPPSLLRRFFDHLKNQDEKILFALVKFYLFEKEPDKDTLDKLDILVTRLSELPGESDLSRVRDVDELRTSFRHLADLISLEAMQPEELGTLLAIIRDMREEILQVSDFQTLMESGIVDRFRELKGRLGRDALNPDVLVEIVMTNISLKNRFRELYREEEVRILEDTNRIFEIERYVEKNPGLAHDDLRHQLEIFRASRKRFDQGRKDNNVRREDVVALKQAMGRVIGAFEPGTGVRTAQPDRGTDPFFLASNGGELSESPKPVSDSFPDPPTSEGLLEPLDEEIRILPEQSIDESPGVTEIFDPESEEIEEIRAGDEVSPAEARPSKETGLRDFGESLDGDKEKPSIMDLLPQDPLLTTALHKITFALELVVWDYPAEQASRAKELHHMRLEPWEIAAYRVLMEGLLIPETLPWQLQTFFLTSTALRVRMEEEYSEIIRIRDMQNRDRLMDILDRAAQSLERARDIDRRFHWFIDDMLFQGDTERLEQVHRSHFRFLNAYSGLWLEHHASGGVTPL